MHTNKRVLLFYCFIVLLFYCFIVLLFYCFIVLLFYIKYMNIFQTIKIPRNFAKVHCWIV